MIYVDPYGLFLQEAGELFRSATVSFADDYTLGATTYIGGERQYNSGYAKAGMVAGIAASWIAGAVTGTLKARIAKAPYQGLKAARAVKAVNGTRTIVQAEKSAVNLNKVRQVARNTEVVENKLAHLKRFNRAAIQLPPEGKNNVRTLRGWAKSKGWEKFSEPGKPEKWGVLDPSKNEYKWNVRIKPEGSYRSNLDSGSNVPRFDARLDGSREIYLNPFTGSRGARDSGTHLPLNHKYY